MKLALMDKLREPINLKNKRHLLAILGTLVIFLSIPLTVALVQQSREPTSRAETIPNDFDWSTQWGPRKIRAPAAWDITTGSRSVKVAVVGTGVGPHQDLNANLITGF